MQPGYLTHKPLCAPSTSAWWLVPSHTYYMGISHRSELPCVPSNGGGSWKTSGTPDSLPISGDSRDLVRDLCDFPGLGTFRQVLPVKKSRHLLLDLFQGSLFTTTSSSARQGSGGTGTGAGPPNLCLATPGAAGRPSASFSLDSPTTSSSSVSLWWSTFHLDTFSTNFSNFVLAKTENTASQLFT